jgi:hypothetical protein
MTPRRREPSVIVPLAGFAPLVVAAAMVSVRGEVNQEVTVLVLATTVALGARFGGRPAGVGAALMAALSFDFFHTKPYLSLSVAHADDILTTVLLLAVGLIVGGLSARATAGEQEARTMRDDASAVRRVLAIAGKGDAEDVELAVRAELTELLLLRDCRFTRGPIDVPELGPNGQLPDPQLRYQDEGFELPLGGFAIRVESAGHRFGHFVCVPVPGVGVHVANRRSAVALAEVLGLVLKAIPTGSR